MGEKEGISCYFSNSMASETPSYTVIFILEAMQNRLFDLRSGSFSMR